VFRSRKGYAFVELLVVIAIIGILAAISITGYQSYVHHIKASFGAETATPTAKP
jgi:prepilin-type N-terminal cleavage/methylation domain-containing protein